MKINISLNLNAIELANEFVGTLYVTEKAVNNIRMMLGDETDDFKTVAKLLFIACNDDELDSEAVKIALGIIEKDLIKKVLRHEFDF